MRTTRKLLALLLAVAMVFTMTAMTALATGGDDGTTTPDGGTTMPGGDITPDGDPTPDGDITPGGGTTPDGDLTAPGDPTPDGGASTTPDGDPTPGGDPTPDGDPTPGGDPTTPEVSAEAQTVIDLIADLPTSEEIQEAMTAGTIDVEAFKAKVSEAREAYEALAEEQKEEVTNIANLIQAEETLALLELRSPLGAGVCEIGTTGYPTLEKAVEAVTAGQTIKLLDNITLSDKPSLQIKNKGTSENPVTLDFNGFTVTGNAEGTGNIVNTTNGVIALQNSYMIFTDSSDTKGGITNNSATRKSTCVLLVGEGSSLIIEGGINLTQRSQSGSSHVLRTKDATTEIRDASLNGEGYIITCHGTGGVTINGGKYFSEKTETVSCFNINSGASVTINGGTFTNWSNLDMAKVGKAKYICCNDKEVTVRSEEPKSYLASIGNFYLENGDLYDGLIARTFPANGDIPDPINIIGEVICTYPEGKYFGIRYGAAKKLTINIEEGGKLSGNMPLRVADVTVTSKETIDDKFFVAANEGDAETYEVITTEVSDGKLYSGRIKDVAVAAWVTWGGNTYSYSDVKDAITAANKNAGSVLKLNQDYSTDKYFNVSTSWTLDLNGHNYIYTGKNYIFNLSSNDILFTLMDSTARGAGKLKNENATVAISTGDKSNNCKIVIGKGVTIEGGTVLISGTNNTLDVYGTIATDNKNTAIQTNGSSTKNSTITLRDGAIVTSNSCAIYHPGTGTLNVYKATVTGGGTLTGIEMRAGTLNVYEGAKITGGKGEPGSTPNGNGTTTNNAAIAVAQHNTKKEIKINISGGTFTGGAAIYESNPQKNEEEAIKLVKMNVSGGEFIGEVSSQDVTGFITGGKFSTDVKKYIKNQYDQLVTDKGTTPFWVDKYSDRDAADAVGQTVYKVTYHFENETVDVYYMTEAEAEEAIKKAGDNVETKEPVAVTPTPSGGGGGSGSYRPVILSPVWNQTVSVVEHGTLTMSVWARGASSYQWWVDRGDGRGFVPIAGATGDSLTIWPDMGDHGNRYYCRAMNGHGGVNSPYFTLCVVRSTLPPKTGDQVCVTLWVCLMALGVAGVLAALNRQRNR